FGSEGMSTGYFRRDTKRRTLCFIGIGAFDEACLRHPIEYPVATLDRPFALTERVIIVWSLGQRRKIGRLRNRKLVHRLVKVNERCSCDTVGTEAEIDLVQVELENLV